MGTIQRGAGKIQKEGVGKVLTKKGKGKIQKEGVGKVLTKKGEGKIQKEGVGKVHTKKGEGRIQKEGVGVTPKEGEGSGMGTGMWGSKRKCSATPPPPQITWCAHQSKDASPDHTSCRRHGSMREHKE